MPRKLRLEFSGACYHVLNRGNYRRPIFGAEGAARAFYLCLDEACTSYGWIAHAFSIMGNHFHFALETPEPNLSDGMQWLQSTWAQRFNRFRGEAGRPFQGRYKAKHVERGDVLAQVVHYIHLNPLAAGLVGPGTLGDYRWSSLAWFPRSKRPRWLDPSIVLTHSGGLADSPQGWRNYIGYLALLAEEDPNSREQKFAELTRGWAIGSPEFRAELFARMIQPIPARFALLGADVVAAREARMEIWEERLRGLATAFGISLDRLPPKKSATEKLLLAAALKRTTSVSIGWLAQRLEMGAPDSVGSLLHRFRVSGGMDGAKFKNVLSRFLA
jgi:REP element-mobilizing transposase RayT